MESLPAVRFARDSAILIAVAALIVIGGFSVTKAYYLSLLTYAGLYGIAALGLFVLFGCAGQISLGQAAFFGVARMPPPSW